MRDDFTGDIKLTNIVNIVDSQWHLYLMLFV